MFQVVFPSEIKCVYNSFKCHPSFAVQWNYVIRVTWMLSYTELFILFARNVSF